MGKSSEPTIGYHYYFGIHMGIGRGPIDELVEIRVADKTVWVSDMSAEPGQDDVQWPAGVEGAGGLIGKLYDAMPDKVRWPAQVTSSQTITIKAQNVFGGKKKEGGIDGTLDVMMGTSDQGVNPNLQAMLGEIMPAFRGVCTLFFDGLVTSMTPYPKRWKMRCRRALKGWDGEPWYPEKAVILLADSTIYAMNPAHVLYECLTNRDWGRGLARTQLDDASYRAAADVLFTEGFGFCRRWSRQSSIGDFMQMVLDHIGAAQFIHRTTGLMTLRLIRSDYDVEALPLFSYSTGLLGVDDDDNGAVAQSTNEMVVKYLDPISNEVHSVRVQNLASIQQVGKASQTREYMGIPTGELAGRVAQRDLRAQSGLAKRFKVRLDRRGYGLEPGAPFRIHAPDRGIANMVLRAGRIEAGTLSEGTITITAVQDIFGLPSSSYVDVQQPLWEPPNTHPQPIDNARLTEMPYRDVVASLNAADAAQLDDTTCAVAAFARRPSGLSLSFDLQTRVGDNGWATRDTGDFCPIAQVTGDIGPTDTVIPIVFDVYLSLVAMGSPALMDDEIVRVDAIDAVAGTITLARGCVDTVPAAHAQDTRIWFYGAFAGRDSTEYAPGTTVDGRLLTRTSSGFLDPALADVYSIGLAQRYGRPYPPGRLRIQGDNYPTFAVGELVVGYAHRDRKLQADQLVDTAQSSIGPEPGVTYNARLRRASDGGVLDEELALEGNEATLQGAFDGDVIVEVEAVRDGLVSWQKLSHTMAYLRSEVRLTEDGSVRVTENGNKRLVEV